jgi:hypothetical protein
MWCRKTIVLAFATGFSLRLLAEPESNDERAETAQPVKTALNATVQDGEKVGSVATQHVVMSMGGRRLMLTAPLGFRANTTNPDKITFANQDFSCVLSFRVVSPGSAAASALNTDLCRGWLASRLVDLSIQEEFSLTVPSGSGPAFDLKCKVDGVVRISRVAFIASPVGVLEFNSLSSPEEAEAAKLNLRFLSRGFRIGDANGQFEILPSQSES